MNRGRLAKSAIYLLLVAGASIRCTTLLDLDGYHAPGTPSSPADGAELDPADGHGGQSVDAASLADDAGPDEAASALDAATTDLTGDASVDSAIDVVAPTGEAGDGEGRDALAAGDSRLLDALASDESAATVDGVADEAAEGFDVDSSLADTGGNGADSSVLDSAAAVEAAADAACATSFLNGRGDVLFSFDLVTSAVGWRTSGSGNGVVATEAWTSGDGHLCPGALVMTIPFGGVATVMPDLEFNFTPPAVWHATKLHAWVKVLVPSVEGYTAFRGVQLFVQSNAFARYSSVQVPISPTLDDAAWHEAVLDLGAPASGPPVATASVGRIGVLMVPLAGSGGAAAPTATLLLDDVWLE